jgi:hypothetical protein
MKPVWKDPAYIVITLAIVVMVVVFILISQ